jgi:transposase-like protein
MTTRSRQRDPAKEQFWRRVVEGFDAQRGTVHDWCVKHGVSQPSFYHWRRELKRRNDVRISDARTHDAGSNASARLLRVKVASAPPRTASTVIIELSGDLRLHVAIDQLIEVLDVSEARSC